MAPRPRVTQGRERGAVLEEGVAAAARLGGSSACGPFRLPGCILGRGAHLEAHPGCRGRASLPWRPSCLRRYRQAGTLPGDLPVAPVGARPCGRPEPPRAGSLRVLPLLTERLKTPGAPFPPTGFLLGIVPDMLLICRSLSAFHSGGDVRALAENYFW